ncbi:hypothetical protein PR048_018551 [Dryococelus australis]|uniref:Uncharacterized protein n=1 Tax=Dryococelus australis TaxID=614101 RepID=A0ABQ9HCM6_9NEOP|nr:hypothetical protein PR048_018551 [Dryococelus australis]
MQHKLHIFVRDSPANMVAVCKVANLNQCWLQCPHSPACCERCFSFINTNRKLDCIRTPYSSKLLKEFQVSNNIPQHKLIQEKPTRWDSSY